MSSDDIYSTDDLFEESSETEMLSIDDVTSPMLESDDSSLYSDTLNDIKEKIVSLSSFNSVVYVDTYKMMQKMLHGFIKEINTYQNIFKISLDYFHSSTEIVSLTEIQRLVHLERSVILSHLYRAFVDGALNQLNKEEHFNTENSFTRYIYDRFCIEQNLSERFSALHTDQYIDYCKTKGLTLDQSLVDTGVYSVMKTTHRLNWGSLCAGLEVEGVGPVKDAVTNRNNKASSLGSTLGLLATHIDTIIISHRGQIERFEISA